MSNESGVEQNEAERCSNVSADRRAIDTRGSRPVRYELIDKWGCCVGTFDNARMAAATAKSAYPDQEQDPDRTGKGWDIQVVGS